MRGGPREKKKTTAQKTRSVVAAPPHPRGRLPTTSGPRGSRGSGRGAKARTLERRRRKKKQALTTLQQVAKDDEVDVIGRKRHGHRLPKSPLLLGLRFCIFMPDFGRGSGQRCGSVLAGLSRVLSPDVIQSLSFCSPTKNVAGSSASSAFVHEPQVTR